MWIWKMNKNDCGSVRRSKSKVGIEKKVKMDEDVEVVVEVQGEVDVEVKVKAEVKLKVELNVEVNVELYCK